MTFNMCDYCPMRRKCDAYDCNMMEDLYDDILLDTMGFAAELVKKRVKEWMKGNKLIKQD